jgi:hypothetical protein
MIQRSFSDMSTDELVDLFAENGVEQDRVLRLSQVSKFKEVFGVMSGIYAELKRRGPQALLALTRLYDHPNVQVQVQAALLTVEVCPDDARSVLEAIAKTRRMPQAADARAELRDHYGLEPNWTK